MKLIERLIILVILFFGAWLITGWMTDDIEAKNEWSPEIEMKGHIIHGDYSHAVIDIEHYPAEPNKPIAV